MALFDFLNFKKKEEKKSNSIPGYTPGQYSQSKIPGYTPGKTTTTTIPGYTPSTRTASKDIDSSAGLYNLAVKNGYQREADRILASQSGEKTKQIFSGGFISDALDTLSALQYGVVGMLKGKTFNEGVKTRQSFTDKDALGDKGIPGIVAGIALDIAFDPLTYIAPVTIVKKVPLLSKLVKGAKELAFGKAVTKTIEGTDKTFEAIEGGTKTGKYLASKLGWMWGADPIFRETFERGTKNVAISTQNVVEMAKGISKLAPETASKLLTKKYFKELGGERFVRVPLQQLQKVLKPDELEAVTNMYNKLDSLGQEAVDLGLLSKDKYEENLGEYIKNAYTEYEQAKNKGMFGFTKVGIKGGKKRVEGLTPEKMAELGQIDNPAYLLFKSSADLTRDVENAKMFKQIAEKFGTDVAQDGFTQIPKTAKYTTTMGKQAEIKTNIGKINTDLKPLLKNLKSTFKADKKILGEISQIEKNIDELSMLREEELYKFFNEGTQITKNVPETRKIMGVAKLAEPLQTIGKQIEKFDGSLDDFIKSPSGIKLEQLYEDGVLQRNGFKTMESLFKYVKEPYKITGGKTVQTTARGNIDKVIQLQKRIESLLTKSKTVTEIDKRSINDSFRYLEQNINDLRFAKEGLQETLADVKLGDLAGKYVPNHMAEYLTDIINPSKDTLTKELVANFKFFKVIMNPGTHARNIVSNKILNYWKLGMNPLDPRVISSDAEAIKEIAKGVGKYSDEARPLGYNLDTFASAEMKGLLDSPEAMNALGKTGKTWQAVKKKLGDIYQAEENQAKLSAYIFNRKHKGLSAEEAWKAAESATFNYAQVTPFVRKLRESLFGFPFITFTVKSTPVVAETLAKAPQRISVIQKIKQGIENLSDIKETDKERELEPSWVKNGFYIKLPIKDKQGRSAYFDLTYILPFGDLMSGNFFEGGTSRETGLPESKVTTAAKKSPFFSLVSELSKNQDFYGNKIWRESDSTEKQLGDIMRHLTKTYAPPLVSDQIPGGYNEKGERQQRGIVGALGASEENQKRNLMQELLRLVGGKIQPIDADIQETYVEWNKKKSLQNMLRERGVLEEFRRFYQPKE